MSSKLPLPFLALLVLPIASAVPGQTSGPSAGQPTAPGLRKLTGDDAKRAEELDKAVDSALQSDRCGEAIGKTEELVALLSRAQGPTHFQTLEAECALRTLRRVASMGKEDRDAYWSAQVMNKRGEALHMDRKYTAAQPVLEQVLAIRRRLLGDDHPETATSYSNLAINLYNQAKHAQAQPLYEQALEIRRRLFTENDPATAASYNNLAYNLNAQGKYAQAQPLYEKGLEIHRRVLTDDHPLTALSYNNVASNLGAQGKYAEAEPLFERALEITRRLLTDGHPDTARSYNNLAGNLAAQGNYPQAQPLLETALRILVRVLPEDHFHIATTYNNLAFTLNAQGKYAEAQVLYEKVLGIRRRLFTDHPAIGEGYYNLAASLTSQGKFAQAQPVYEKGLEILHRLLGDDHPHTATGYNNAARNLNAQGKYLEARDRWLIAAKSLDAARARIAFSGLERAGATRGTPRPALAAVLARLGQPAEAWRTLEEDLGRGLLDELAARQDRRLTEPQRARLRELTTELERLDKLAESLPKELDKAGRAKQLEGLTRERELASIALGEFHTKLVAEHGPLAGQVAELNEIQAALPGDAALLAWVDIPPAGPNAADPDGEHWGVVVRSKGTPVWSRLSATDPDKHWSEQDSKLPRLVRGALRERPSASSAAPAPLAERLRAQRLDPFTAALGATADGLPSAQRLFVLPSPAMTGVPIEALLASDDTRIVSYAPSATVLTYLRKLPRSNVDGGLLALGDPVFERTDSSPDPGPLPDHGLLVNLVVPGSNAAAHGIQSGDVLLAYNGTLLRKREDLKAVDEPGKRVAIEIWRAGRVLPREVASGKLGVVLDTRPAAAAIQDQQRFNQVLAAARSGSEHFERLPGTRYEVEALAQLFESVHRLARVLTGSEASEPALVQLADSGALGRFGFIHLATHGLIDEAIPQNSAVILTQTDLPDPLAQVLNHKPVFDGRIAMREIQRSWEMKAELVTLSACETAGGRYAGGEGFVGFTQALLMSGARSVCVSLWKVDDTATALLMQRFYANILGAPAGVSKPMSKARALAEAKQWLRNLPAEKIETEIAALERGVQRKKLAMPRAANGHKTSPGAERPFAHPYYWAAFVLVGDPD